jgi:hypothetical protein
MTRHLLTATLLAALTIPATADAAESPHPWDSSTWRLPLALRMTQNGDGTTENANLDCSVTPCYWEARPPSGETWIVTALIVSITDTKAGFSATTYGAIPALTNGLHLHRVVGTGGGATLSFDVVSQTGAVVRTNVGWATFCFNFNLATWGTGDDSMVVKCELYEGTNMTPILLRGDKNEALRLEITDNLTGLSGHYFVVHGTRENGVHQIQ